ncbi:MAG: hypothetical protein AB7U30_02225 [Sulfuricellaceae bacterium]
MRTSLSLLLGCCFLTSAAFAAGHDHGGVAPAARGLPAWTHYPLLVAARGGDRAGVRVAAANLVAPVLDVYAPKNWSGEGHWELPLAGGAEVRPASEVGNYHWLAARAEMPEYVAVATSAFYFANPGPAPTAMLGAKKSELEVIPQPLPREHAGYRSGEEWPFLVRFQGEPLKGQKLVLETANGSRAEFVTGEDGVAKVRFPADFKAEEGRGNGHGRRQAGFVVAAEYEAGGTGYLTTFNYSYGPGAYDNKSLWAGAGFAVLGMGMAVPLLRRRKENQNG